MAIFASLCVIVIAVVLGRWRLRKRPTTFGAARWLPAWSAQGKGLFRDDGLLIGDWTGRLPVYYSGGGHALTVAPTGCGKGTCAIIPNLLRRRWIFLIDPGGENTAVAIGAWRRKGFRILCLNPWGMHAAAPWSLPSHSLNPLAILDPSSRSFASDADLLAEMIVTRSGRESGSSGYFKDEAQSGLRAMLMHIATAEAPARRNLLTLRRYICAQAHEWEALLAAMKENPSGGGLIAREAAQLERREAQAGEEFSAVLSTMKQDTNFIEDPVMQDALCGGTADLSALKGFAGGKEIPGCAVSVVMPLEYLDTHAAYARLITAVALWTMQRGDLARGRVLFLLDEFPALGPMKRIATGLATLRKYRVWLWPIVQNLAQLKNLYGANWQTFISNAGLLQFMGAGDLETAQYVSTYCGEATIEIKTRGPGGVSRSPTRRHLATPDEIMCLREDLQIVSIGNLKPLVVYKTPYWQRPELAGLFSANPYHAGTPEISLLAPVEAAWGKAMHFCAWLMRPATPVVVLMTMLAVFLLRPGVLVKEQWRPAQGTMYCVYVTASGVRAAFMTRVWTRPTCSPVYLSIFQPVLAW